MHGLDHALDEAVAPGSQRGKSRLQIGVLRAEPRERGAALVARLEVRGDEGTFGGVELGVGIGGEPLLNFEALHGITVASLARSSARAFVSRAFTAAAVMPSAALISL